MKREDLPVPSPCNNSPYEEALDKKRGRHCWSCNQEVHNLSAMSRDEAEALLERGDDLCVHYLYRKDNGEVLFRDHELLKQSRKTVQLQSQRRGVRRLLKAAAVAVPLLVAGCDDPSGDREAETEAVAASGEDDAVASGSPGDSPVEDGDPAAAVPPPPEEDLEEAADDIAARIDAQSRKVAERMEDDETAFDEIDGISELDALSSGDTEDENMPGTLAEPEVGVVAGGMVVPEESKPRMKTQVDIREGNVDEGRVVRGLLGVERNFKGVYEDYLRQNPDSEGVVKVEIRIGERESRAEIDWANLLSDDVAKDDSVGEQIIHELERGQIRMPPPQDGAVVELTLDFSSG